MYISELFTGSCSCITILWSWIFVILLYVHLDLNIMLLRICDNYKSNLTFLHVITILCYELYSKHWFSFANNNYVNSPQCADEVCCICRQEPTGFLKEANQTINENLLRIAKLRSNYKKDKYFEATQILLSTAKKYKYFYHTECYRKFTAVKKTKIEQCDLEENDSQRETPAKKNGK